jgi:HEAT repeat protein
MLGRGSLLGIAFAGLLFNAASGGAGGEFAGKSTGEWLKILREGKEVKHRSVAILALATIGPKVAGVTAGLIDAMREDPEPEIRREIAIMLGRLGPDARGATEALGERLAKDTSDVVRQAAATALGGKLAKEAEGQVKVLAAALKDKHEGTRRAAAETLKNLGELAEPAIPQLLEVAKDRSADRFTRVYAVQVIGLWGKDHEASGPTLALVLADKDTPVAARQAAAEGLGRFGGDFPAGPGALGQALLSGPPELRRSAAVALGQIGEKSAAAWPAIKKTLEEKGSDSSARYPLIRAAASLARQQSEAVPLLAKLAQEDEAVENRLVAIQELGDLGEAALKAVPILEAIAQADARAALRQAAEAAVKKIKG